jgi:cell division protein FtsZ
MAFRAKARHWIDTNLRLLLRSRADAVGPRLLVVGVGGAGGNAINNMIDGGLSGVEFCAINTDLQALEQSLARRRVQIGPRVTRGLGAGARVEIGRAAAEESMDDIKAHLRKFDVVFITAGMGGGTGTGAAPVITRLARSAGILTIAVVTKPFRFEGDHRMRAAQSGIEEMQFVADTLIVIPNENLFTISDAQTTFADAFRMADEVLHDAVRGISDLMITPGLVNLDFADIRTVMTDMGQAMTATGMARGDNRAIAAAEAAISNPLIEDCSMNGARSVLINVTGGPDLTLFEVNEAVSRIRAEADRDANIIFGSTFNKKMAGEIRINVVATGIDSGSSTVWQVTREAQHEAPELTRADAVPSAPRSETNLPPDGELPGRTAAPSPGMATVVVSSVTALCLAGAIGISLMPDPGSSEAPPAALQAEVAPEEDDIAVAEAAVPPLPAVEEPARELTIGALPEVGSSVPGDAVPADEARDRAPPDMASAKSNRKSASQQERPLRSGYKLQLGAFRSENAAREEIRRIHRLHALLLDRADPAAQRIEIADRGPPWRVRIGPIAEKDAAEKLCDALNRRRTECLLVEAPSAASVRK